MSYQERTPHAQRRRRTFGTGSVVIAALAAYGTYHLALWAWNACSSPDDEGKNKGQNENIHSSSIRNRLRQRRMARCRREIVISLSSLGAILRRKIDEGTDMTVYRSQLREIRKMQSNSTKHQEEVLWMKIQVETVSRVVTNVYAYALLFTALTIQAHCLAGSLFRKENCDATNEEGVDEHNALLLSYDAFLERGGVDDLLSSVRNSVVESIKDWSIQDPTALHMTAPRLQQAINQIRIQMENGNLLQKYVVVDKYESVIDNVALLNETYDLLESPVANDATRECLDCVFAALELHYMSHIFGSSMTGVPLARVVTQLKTSNTSFFQPDILIPPMEKLPAVQEAALTSFGR
jgi:hypothetical protein